MKDILKGPKISGLILDINIISGKHFRDLDTMGSNTNSKQLNILIVGAGIAGLTTVTALKHAGHKVTVSTLSLPIPHPNKLTQIFESSKLLHEVGAAINPLLKRYKIPLKTRL